MESLARTVETPLPTRPLDPGRHSLPEFHHYQRRAGHPDWASLAADAADLARDLLPKLTPPSGASRIRRRRIAAHATALNNYRVNRRRHAAGRWDLLPLYFIWTVHRGCNFRCEYCDDHQGRRYPDLPAKGTLDTADAEALLATMRSRTPSVYFAGGEPMLRADLPRLVRKAAELRYFPIVANTNASVVHEQLGRPRWRRWLADMDIVVVSLDSLDADAAAELWAHDRPGDVYRNLLLLRELSGPLGFELMVNTLLRPGRLDEAADVLDFANDLGICLCPVPMNTGPRIHDGLLGDPEYRRLTDTILGRKRAGYPIAGSTRMNERLLGSAPKTCRNTLKPHIDHDGSLIGGFNDYNSVVRHGVYGYDTPIFFPSLTTIPLWMLLFWGMILRFLATLTASSWLGAAASPGDLVRIGQRPVHSALVKIAMLLALVVVTRQCIYRLYLDPWWSWLPFALAFGIYWALFYPRRHDVILAATALVAGPLIEILYIRVAHLHHYHLGWFLGVPLWIVLWWAIALLVWKDLGYRLRGWIDRLIPWEDGREDMAT